MSQEKIVLIIQTKIDLTRLKAELPNAVLGGKSWF